MTITLPLPAELTSTFVVAVERTPADLETIAPWRVAAPYRRAAVEAYGTPALRVVTRRRSQWKPIGVTLAEEDRRLLRRTRHHLLVTTTCALYELPHNLQVARATARALAKEYSGLVIDPVAGTPVLSCDRCVGEPADFRLADDWLGWDVQVHDDATCPPWDPAGTGSCSCLRVTSRGLSRFALPEITLDGAACAHNLCAMTLLRTVATRLLADHLTFLTTHPTATERTIDDHLRIDQAFFPGGPPFNVHLTPYAPQPPTPGSHPAPITTHDPEQRANTARPAPAPGRPAAAPPHAGPTALPGGVTRHGLKQSDMAGHSHVAPPEGVAMYGPERLDTVGHSYAAASEGGGSSGARLRVAPVPAPEPITHLKVGPASGSGQVTCLKVGPPSDFAGSLNDWLCVTQSPAPALVA
ncbi:hypothetical protein ACIBHX_27055 [Nonomuraea sp. NPDC050536]|uniref:hypothetical protein n=1 Tax=Nonomuraea sp. NPDC050536 TaxID=3364366 RepID=UPI0037CC09CC